MENGIYFEVFAVKDGVRYNAKIISINDVTKILTNSLMDGVGEVIGVKEENGMTVLIRCRECGNYCKNTGECNLLGHHPGENGYCSRAIPKKQYKAWEGKA